MDSDIFLVFLVLRWFPLPFVGATVSVARGFGFVEKYG